MNLSVGDMPPQTDEALRRRQPAHSNHLGV